MSKRTILAGVLLLCIFLTGCGTKDTGDGGGAGDIGNSGNAGSGEDARETGNTGSGGTGWQGVTAGMDLTTVTDRVEYYDLTVESEPFELGLWEKNQQEESVWVTAARGGEGYIFLGMQFYQGEPVQLWVRRTKESSKVWLYQKDGSGEIILEDAPMLMTQEDASASSRLKWFMDENGDFYGYYTEYPGMGSGDTAKGVLVKLGSDGETLYKTDMGPGTTAQGFCRLQDGRNYVLFQEDQKETLTLAQTDPDTGEIIEDSRLEIPMSQAYLGDGGDCPALVGYYGQDRQIVRVNTNDGSLELVISFTGTSYGWHSGKELRTFRVRTDGSADLIWVHSNYRFSSDGKNFFTERLRMEKVEKIPIVLRGVFYGSQWVAIRAAQFNRESDTYHVVVEDCGMGNDEEDFARLTSVQVGAGKGPDILCGDPLLGDYISGMLAKGALEDLRPYMEASGVREEDYFPLVFSNWRQGEEIYGVSPGMSVAGVQIRAEVLGNRETPDIETLADALLAWEEDSIYYRGADSGMVLNMLLWGSDSLWGMVDWESGVCDFDTPLFHKLLEAAGRHGDNGRKNRDLVLANTLSFENVIQFDGSETQTAENMVTCGTLFDDGCYAVSYPRYTMAINAASAHKEGAWEFIRFLIGEEAQNMESDPYQPPVQKEVFERWMQEKVIYELTEMRYVNGVCLYPAYYGVEISELKQEEYRQGLENARSLPIRTAPVLDIIREETGPYFDGSKKAEDVIDIINNRVQLYLDEIG